MYLIFLWKCNREFAGYLREKDVYVTRIYKIKLIFGRLVFAPIQRMCGFCEGSNNCDEDE